MNDRKRLPKQAPATAALALGILTTVYLGLLAPDALSTSAGHEARTISVNDTANLHLVHFHGNTLVEEGRTTGTLPGSAHASLVVSASNVRASFTIYLHGGSISGQGTARLNVGRGDYASFAGSLTVNHGTGHYAHASGSGRLSGTIRRSNDAAVVEVVGQLHM
jgi:hypothetical protein